MVCSGVRRLGTESSDEVCEQERRFPVEGEKERTNWILGTELEFQPEHFVHVEWVCVEDFDVELPFLEAFCGHQLDSWR